ncbi:MAG: helix-turn-helix domain-containing protein [Candidatus Falkowbacteria bacterium]
MLYKQLQDAGLNEIEAKLYIAALELGQTTVGRLAQKAGIKRTTAYLSLESLSQKGLIATIHKAAKKYYYAEDPRSLEQIMAERQQRISKLIPELLAFTNLVDKKPGFRYFEGMDGIKHVFEDALEYPNTEICMLYSESYQQDFDPNYFSSYYVPKRVAKKISSRTILPDNPAMHELAGSNQKSLRQTKLISADLFKLKIEIMIYEKHKVSIVSFAENFGLIIESPRIHESFLSIFETIWALAK